MLFERRTNIEVSQINISNISLRKVTIYKLVCIAFFITVTALASVAFYEGNVERFNKPIIDNQSIGVVFLRGDSLSKKVAFEYANQRNIPAEHIYEISMPLTNNVKSVIFNKQYERLNQNLPNSIQALVITWSKPYRVECMSVTSAFSFGFDRKWCKPEPKNCHPTAISPYYNNPSRAPWNTHNIRPTMMLTGLDFNKIEKNIANGVLSDYTNPKNAAVALVRTRDSARSKRYKLFEKAKQKYKNSKKVDVQYIEGQLKKNVQHVTDQVLIGYQTGIRKVPFIASNTYLPGSFADHLTSFGGKGLIDDNQMRSIRWLEAGVTASYGTVVEPCNYIEKFPDPNVLLDYYLKGETILEAYYKSVKMPGEGLFMGEPLARPFGNHDFHL